MPDRAWSRQDMSSDLKAVKMLSIQLPHSYTDLLLNPNQSNGRIPPRKTFYIYIYI